MTESGRPARPRSRRRHPALGARIAATGLSTTAMLGFVAALGAQSPAASVGPEPAVAGQSMVGAGVKIVTGSVHADPTVSTTHRVEVSALSGRPIQLTANPVVRAAPPGLAATQTVPVARTNGSR